MTKTQTLFLLLLILTVCFGVAALPALWLDVFPAWVGALVLIGFFIFVFLLSLLAAKWLSEGRRAEYFVRLQQRQGTIRWACGVAAVGMCLSGFGHGIVEVVGLVITFACVCVFWWAVLRALPAKTNGTTADGGHYQI
jgi:cobalamin synthase